ncbi:MAG: C45 family peptidase [Solobacterium sp.]|nr:C45 family peptidase [Solobacterium sp.]
MKILEFYGNEYTIGQQIGSHFKDILQAQASVYEKYLEKEYIAAYITGELDILRRDMPGIYDELMGRGEGSGVRPELITLMTSCEVTAKENGCTTVIVRKEDGTVLFSHNEDEDDFTKENSAVIVYHYDDIDVYAYTNAWKLPGSADGWNSRGMVFTSNYLFYDDPDPDRVSRYIAAGAVYRAGSVDEAADMVRNMKTASPFSINIFDTNEKKAVNIERDLDTCYITQIEGKYSRSNHFLMREAKSSVSSDYRLARTRELLMQKEIRALKDITDILDDTGEDEDHTVHIPGIIETHGRTVINLAVDSNDRVVTIRNFLDDTTAQFRL